MDGLDIEQGWFVECWRCANDSFIAGGTKHEAMRDFEVAGWAKTEHGYQLCPQCRGVK